MKKILFYAFCFLLNILFFSPAITAQTKFQISYIGNGNIGYSIQADSVGYILAGTTSSSGQGGQDVLIIRTNLYGDISWAKTIGGAGNEVAHSIKRTSDGGYIIVGSTSSYVSTPGDSSNFYIIKLTFSGNIQWTRAIGSFDVEVAKDVIETYDHKFAIVGYTKSIGPGNEDIYLMELDSTGSVLWSYGMGGSGSDFGNSLVQTSNHDLFIVGSTTGFGAVGQIPYLVVTDELGVMQTSSYTFDLNTTMTSNKRYFTKIIEGYFNDYVITGSDGLGSIGDAQHFILDIGQNVAVNWMKKYFMNSGEGVGASLDKTVTGGFIIGGTMGIDHPALIEIDGIGQLISTKFYPAIGSSYYGKGLEVKSASDGGFALLGYRYNSTDTSVYLVKTNNALSSGCDEEDGFINSVSNMSPTVNVQIGSSATGSNYMAIDSGVVATAFPFMNVICFTTGIKDLNSLELLQIHQSDNSIYFQLNDPNDFIVRTKIFSSTGGELKVVNNSYVNAVNFPKGIYFYQVITNKQKSYSGKFIFR